MGSDMEKTEQFGIKAAVDVGSTSIGIACINASDNSEICSFSFSNPQVKYGADIITRIKRCIDDPKLPDIMSKELRRELFTRISEKLGENNISYGVKTDKSDKNDEADKADMSVKYDIYDNPEYKNAYISEICYSGNTTMLHILRGLSVKGLSKAPFTPVTLDYHVSETRVLFDDEECDNVFSKENLNSTDNESVIREHYLSGISAFIGADILSGAEFLKMGRNEGYDLLIDLGTNGELLLLNKHRGYAASCACGPVFDHGVTGARYGSESIHAIAGCVKRGLIDKTGLISEPFFDKGIELDKGFVIRQEQVRRFQMAKAAIYAGVKCLMKKAGIGYTDIDKVFISGGLGFYLDVRDAFITKMLPEDIKDKITVSGNTSLEGAKRFIMAYDDAHTKDNKLKDDVLAERSAILRTYDDIRRRTEAFELADYEDFQDIYIGAMNF